MKLLEWIALRLKLNSTISIIIGTDCTAVINRLLSDSPVTNFSTFLHQIVREIRLIRTKIKIDIIPKKIKAHLNDYLAWDALSLCDSTAK